MKLLPSCTWVSFTSLILTRSIAEDTPAFLAGVSCSIPELFDASKANSSSQGPIIVIRQQTMSWSPSKPIPVISAGISVCTPYTRTSLLSRLSFPQSNLCLWWSRNTNIDFVPSLIDRLAHLSNRVIARSGIWNSAIVYGFLMTPVLVSNNFDVLWILPVDPK